MSSELISVWLFTRVEGVETFHGLRLIGAQLRRIQRWLHRLPLTFIGPAAASVYLPGRCQSTTLPAAKLHPQRGPTAMALKNGTQKALFLQNRTCSVNSMGGKAGDTRSGLPHAVRPVRPTLHHRNSRRPVRLYVCRSYGSGHARFAKPTRSRAAANLLIQLSAQVHTLIKRLFIRSPNTCVLKRFQSETHGH